MTLAAACDASSGDEATTSGDGGTSGVGGATGNGGSTGVGGDEGDAPTVTDNTPSDHETDVATNENASATFSEAMNCATLTADTFTLTMEGGDIPVPGTVICSESKAVFWPAAHLQIDSSFTATITTGAESAAGVALAEAFSWSFDTGDSVGPGMPVNLGTAGDFVILAKSAISTVPTSAVTGDVGVSPAAATFITGFALIADPSNVFSTSTQVTGRVYAADYTPPAPANLTTAVGDMEIAFTDAAARAPDVTELGEGNIGGMTLAPGVYKWGTGLLIPTSVTLEGSATDVWIFQIAQDLTVSSATSVMLNGGALPKNVFWQVSGLVDVGTTAHFEGVILTQTSVTLRTGASIDGRLLAQTAVDIDAATVVEPAP